MSANEDFQTSCMCIKSSQSFSHELMIAQTVKTCFGKSCDFHGHVPEDSYFSGVLHFITQHSIPDVLQEHVAFIFKGLEFEKNIS